MITGLFDTCAICGRPAIKPGYGLCRWHEIQALIDLSFDRMRAALRGDVPVIGKRLQSASGGKKNERLRGSIL